MSEKGADAKFSTMLKIFFVSIFFVSICALLMIHGCEKTSECKMEPGEIEQVTFKFMGDSLNSKFEIRKLTTEKGNPFELVMQTECEKGDNDYIIYEELFQSFKKYAIAKNLMVDNQTFTFILYYDLPISQSLGITDEHITGIRDRKSTRLNSSH